MATAATIVRILTRIEGLSPLLYHRFTGASGPGSAGDKNPRKQAEQHLHTVQHPEEGTCVYLPGSAIFGCLVNAGVFVKLGKSKMTTSKSSLVPAYLGIEEETPFLYKDGRVVTTQRGWEVDTRAVVNPTTGGRMLAHRPRVDTPWRVDFTLVLFEAQTCGTEKARELIDHAGTKIGLLAYRPQKKGGMGKFHVTRWDREED